MKKRKTLRGFELIEFKDANGVECSLQESSRVGNLIWLGCDDADPQYMPGDGTGWHKLEVPHMTKFNTRMHLTRQQVKKLLPHLERFVETGTL